MTESGIKVMQQDNQRGRRLERQMAMVARPLSEIASLLESRLGETADLAASARIIEQGFEDLARKIHNQSIQVEQESGLVSKSQSA